MKTTLRFAFIAILGLTMSNLVFGQAPNLGTAANFVLFSTDGAITNTGHSQYIGHVGANIGDITGFGNVNGQMHNLDGVTAQAAADLLGAYNEIAALPVDFYPTAVLMGNGETLIPGVYVIPSSATIDLVLNLDALGDANAVFIFKVLGTLSTSTFSEVKLINGAMACNVFWSVEGMVSMASNSTMRGTIIANNSAIAMNAGDVLEGRALSTTGAITVDGVTAAMPIGCSVPVLTGPALQPMGTTELYALLSANGAVTNTGITSANGQVGTNVGLTTGFDALLVTGEIHPIADVSTADAAADLAVLYGSLNSMGYDIQLLYPAQFGSNLVLTPHTYLLNAATVLTDTVFLDALGNSDAVFVLLINGAFSTSVYSNVVLLNGAQAKNVFWKVEGAVDIDVYSVFSGTIIANNGAVNINVGVELNGRAFTTAGSLIVNSISVNLPTGGIVTTLPSSYADGQNISVSPNPFDLYTTVHINDLTQVTNCQILIYNILGEEMYRQIISANVTTIETGGLAKGIYFYKVIGNNTTLQSGKLVSNN